MFAAARLLPGETSKAAMIATAARLGRVLLNTGSSDESVKRINTASSGVGARRLSERGHENGQKGLFGNEFVTLNDFILAGQRTSTRAIGKGRFLTRCCRL
jgi:hypothetical protein